MEYILGTNKRKFGFVNMHLDFNWPDYRKFCKCVNPYPIKIKIVNPTQGLIVKMGGEHRIVTDLYTYVIKKHMTFSTCGQYEDEDVSVLT